jgi:hypothetical protein
MGKKVEAGLGCLPPTGFIHPSVGKDNAMDSQENGSTEQFVPAAAVPHIVKDILEPWLAEMDALREHSAQTAEGRQLLRELERRRGSAVIQLELDTAELQKLDAMIERINAEDPDEPEDEKMTRETAIHYAIARTADEVLWPEAEGRGRNRRNSLADRRRAASARGGLGQNEQAIEREKPSPPQRRAWSSSLSAVRFARIREHAIARHRGRVRPSRPPVSYCPQFALDPQFAYRYQSWLCTLL